MTNYQEVDYKEAFSLIDNDGDGKVDIKHLGTLMRASGLNPSNMEINSIISELKQDYITYITFKELLTKVSAENEDQVNEAFRLFDRDNRGYVSTAELKHVMTTLGEKMTAEEAERMIKDADPNNTGKIEYAEFVRNMLAKR